MTVGVPAANEVMAAGYLGVRPRPRPEWVDVRYVRDPLLSLAGDLVATGPTATWVGSADEELAALGVPADQLGDAKAWIDELERAPASCTQTCAALPTMWPSSPTASCLRD